MSDTKPLPFDAAAIERALEQFPTPFYLYDEAGIVDTVARLQSAFAWAPGFREYFAVKATPNPHILKVLHGCGLGADCSSLPELVLAERVGLRNEEIFFTSNNTPRDEFAQALALDAILNFDDLSHIPLVLKEFGAPPVASCRYNPGEVMRGNRFIGNPAEAKYGFTREQLWAGYRELQAAGVPRFGLHTMVVSNELDGSALLATARMLFELAAELRDQLGLPIEFINLGGGIGIPYRPEQRPVDVAALGRDVQAAYQEILVPRGLDRVRIYMENGRCITGPHGVLVTRAIHKKHIYRQYVGVDASMANLMRPAIYGAYHHITVLGKEHAPHDVTVDVVGSLCENNDKFAIGRALPAIDVGDVLVLHDAGAHGHAMGFQYNGKLRSAEVLLRRDGSLQQIRRAETLDDYFATLDFSQV